MAVISEFERSQALERIDTNMRILKDLVEGCKPEAISQVKTTTELIKSKRITGEISSWDYRVYNLLLDEQIQKFMKNCSCECEV